MSPATLGRRRPCPGTERKGTHQDHESARHGRHGVDPATASPRHLIRLPPMRRAARAATLPGGMVLPRLFLGLVEVQGRGTPEGGRMSDWTPLQWAAFAFGWGIVGLANFLVYDAATREGERCARKLRARATQRNRFAVSLPRRTFVRDVVGIRGRYAWCRDVSYVRRRAMERRERIAHWMRLTGEKLLYHGGHPAGGAHPAEHGLRKAAGELVFDERDVRRAVVAESLPLDCDATPA